MRDNSKITTLKLTKNTKTRLEKLKSYRRETYDELLEKILEMLNLIRLDPESARARLSAIDRQNRKFRKKPTQKKKKTINKLPTLQNKTNLEI